MTDPSSKRVLLAPAWLVAGLAVLGLALWAGLLSMRPPAPRGADAPADVFAAGRAVPTVERLLGDGAPHPVGTPANDNVRERLVAELARAGYEATLQEAFVCREPFASCAYVTNVLARLEGREDGPAVMLAAHYDSVAAAPGASDDMAGVAAVVEVARMLRREGPLRNPVIFLLSDGEEAGLLGAQAFVDHHPWAGEVGLAVNLEARGSRGQSILFEAAGGNARLVRAFAREAPRPVTNSLLYEVYRALPNDTDFTVFREAGMAGVNFAYVDGVAHYHTPLDDLATLSRGSLQHHGDNLLAAARAFGDADPGAPPGGDAVFMDLVPGSVVQAPLGWALPLAAAGLVAWIALATAAVRVRAAGGGAIVLGIVAVVVGTGLAGAAAQGAAAALAAAAGGAAPWHAVPVPARVAVWASAAAGLLIPVIPAARRVGFRGLTIAVWLVWGLAAVALAAALPGASVIVLVPLLVATAVLGPTALAARRRPAAAAVATLATAFVTAFVWLPTALVVELGVGFESSAAIGVAVALALGAAVPLLATARRGAAAGGALLAGAAAAAVVAGGWALRVPPLTPDAPQRMNVVHYQGPASAGSPPRASWLVAPSAGDGLPAAMRDAAPFSAHPEAALPGSPQPFFVAPAPVLPGPGPRIVVLADKLRGGERVLRLRLDADVAPLRLDLRVVGGVALREVTFAGGERIGFGAGSGDASRAVTCWGVRCAGIELEVRASGRGAFDLQLVRHAAGLPPAGDALVDARPATAVPSQDGDVSVAVAALHVDAFEPAAP